MEIVQVASPNYGYPRGKSGRNGESVQAIVLHIAQGYEAGLDSIFQNQYAQVSAHYAVMRDGTVHQYVLEDDTAWHCGDLGNPDALPWLPKGSYGMLANLRTIGIEHEGFYTEPLTDEQKASSFALVKELVERWRLPISRDTIIGHYRLNHWTRQNDPGPLFPWSELFAFLGGNVRTLEQQTLIDVVNGWSGRTGAPGNLTELAVRLRTLEHTDIADAIAFSAARELAAVAEALEREWPV